MINKKKILSIIMLTIIICSVYAQQDGTEFTIQTIYIIDAYRADENFVRGFFTFKEQDEITLAELEDQCLFIRQRLLHSGLYSSVEYIIDPYAEDNTVDVYITLVESTVYAKNLDQLSTIFFYDLPLYSWKAGLVLGPGFYGAGFAFPLPAGTDLVYAVGYESLVPDDHNLAMALSPGVDVFNDIHLSFPVKYVLSFAEDDQYRHDISVKGQCLFDYSYFKYLYYTGFKLNYFAQYGLWEQNYLVQYSDLRLYLLPFKHFELALRASGAMLDRTTPLYIFPPLLGERAAAVTGFLGTKLLNGSAEVRLLELFSLDLAVFRMGFNLVGFTDLKTSFDRFEQLAWDMVEISAGGGVKLDLGPPLSIALRFEGGYRFNSEQPFFAFIFGDYF